MLFCKESQSRYATQAYPNGALLRINPVRPVRDETTWECVAENGVGDTVTASAQLTVYEGESCFSSLLPPLFLLLARRLDSFTPSNETSSPTQPSQQIFLRHSPTSAIRASRIARTRILTPSFSQLRSSSFSVFPPSPFFSKNIGTNLAKWHQPFQILLDFAEIAVPLVDL